MSEIGRRDFLKAILPLGWVPEAVKAGGIGGLSTPAKISLVKDAALLLSGAVGAKILFKEGTNLSFKEKVLSFRWEQAKGGEFDRFVSNAADEYLRLTGSTRVSKADLTGSGRINFYQNRDQMMRAVKESVADFSPTPNQWGYTAYKDRKVFIDLGTLKNQTGVQAKANSLDPDSTAGMALLDALWHEWGHLDIEERTQGQLINNPKYSFYSPESKKDEQFRRYRGAAVFTDTYYGFLRFEEVLNETITVKRMGEQVGLDKVFSAADYYQNGIDFFPLFTAAAGISLDDLYRMHSSSDFEGLNRLIGSKLPGDEGDLEKGVRLSVAIHRSDREVIRQTGIFSTINSKK